MSELVEKLSKTPSSITCNNENSMFLKITRLTQQGFNPEPILFLININDLYRSSSKLALIMFVDDRNLFISDSIIESPFETIYEELLKLAT